MCAIVGLMYIIIGIVITIIIVYLIVIIIIMYENWYVCLNIAYVEIVKHCICT